MRATSDRRRDFAHRPGGRASPAGRELQALVADALRLQYGAGGPRQTEDGPSGQIVRFLSWWARMRSADWEDGRM